MAFQQFVNTYCHKHAINLYPVCYKQNNNGKTVAIIQKGFFSINQRIIISILLGCCVIRNLDELYPDMLIEFNNERDNIINFINQHLTKLKIDIDSEKLNNQIDLFIQYLFPKI